MVSRYKYRQLKAVLTINSPRPLCGVALLSKNLRRMLPVDLSVSNTHRPLCAYLLVMVELKGAKTHTVIYRINRREFYCAVDLPLSDYPLYGNQLVES